MTGSPHTASGLPCPADCKSALDEAELEAAINAAHERLISATDWDDKLTHWREMVRLMDQRSSPPSSPVRIAKASAGCRGDAAGGVL